MIKINYMKIILKEGLVGLVSRSIRRLASPKRKLKKKILFLMEGKTEKNFIFHLFDQNDYSNISFSVKEYHCLGYANEAEQKADEHLFSKYASEGGSFSTAERYFSGRPLFYMKKDFSQGTIQNEYVNAEQSSLYYLRDYLQILDHA